MPVVKLGQKLPAWCDVSSYEIFNLEKGQKKEIALKDKKAAVVICAGTGVVSTADGGKTGYTAEAILMLTEGFEIYAETTLEVCVVHGDLGEKCVWFGLFTVNEAGKETAVDAGTKADYFRNSDFDNHYHDCDEYWIILSGSGTAYTENKPFEVEAGDCVITGAGWHHDFPVVKTPVRGVYYETTMTGQKRGGHLHEHTHGAAVPQKNKV